jgi:transposase
VNAVESGASRREAADWFEVSPSSAIKWMQRRQATGSIAPQPSGGSISPLEAHAAFLFALIARRPDLTLDEIVVAMHKRTIAGSRSAVWRFFQRHKITFKKSLRAAEQERADVARARRRWMREQGMFDPARLVFLDETATSTNMVRLRGRCPRGQRLIDHVPHGHWKTITFVAGLRRRAMVAPLVLDGPMNATIFVTYLKECLVPKLKRGDVVMMDSLPVHRVAAVREVIEAAGAKLRYLPKYSPDLNPIEQAFSKLKAHLRKAAEPTIPRLSRRIGALVSTFSPQECANYFRHAGYAST